ncbi:MAG: NAD(P)-dependent oxidoreductase [Algisphaera sp.]
MPAKVETTRLAVMLELRGRRCVVVGGGAVALRRATTLVQHGARVRVVAPVVDPAFATLEVEVTLRPYVEGDLEDAFLVVVATSHEQVNVSVADHAREAGVLVNRADLGGDGDVTLMAQDRKGPLTVAVDSGGASAAAAQTLCAGAMKTLGPDWPVLLEEARTRRLQLRGKPEKLRQLTDEQAMAILQRSGRAALSAYLDTVVTGE